MISFKMQFLLKLCLVKCTMFKIVYTVTFLSFMVTSEILKGASNWATSRNKNFP